MSSEENRYEKIIYLLRRTKGDPANIAYYVEKLRRLRQKITDYEAFDRAMGVV